MSYNIDTFKVKKLENLVIPVELLFTHSRKDFHPEKKLGETDDSYVRFKFAESCYLEGLVVDGMLTLKDIDWHGEFSGYAMNELLEPVLGQSTGELVASCVWEGGDSINRLEVKDGEVNWVDIDI